MSAQSIVKKLQNHLANGINTECEVVYLLAEIRKLIDDKKPRPWPLALWLHCNWALHVDLGQPNTTIDLLRKIDNYVLNKNIVGLPKPDGSFSFIDEHYLAKELVFLENFRQEMGSFLALNGLPDDVCREDGPWFSFMAAYAGVIEDGTLSMGRTEDLKVVEEVKFAKGRSLSSRHHLPFIVRWVVHLKDGRSLDLELQSVLGAPAEARMHAIAMKLNPAPDGVSS